MNRRSLTGILATCLLALTACGQTGPETPDASTESSSAEATTAQESSTDASSSNEAAADGPREITDARGTVTIPADPQRIVATDNRIFQTLADWNVELVAAPVSLIPESISYKTQEGIANLGNHREPDLEALVAANPDLVINGQRFEQYYDDIKKLVPEAALVDSNVKEDQPLDQELIRITTMLGEALGHEDEASQLVSDFEGSIDRAKSAYNKDWKVMAVITSGGSINYAAPTTGRALGPVYDILELTPALESDGSTDHQGDDISVEAIAEANPDWILVLDRDASVANNPEEGYRPANEILAESDALKNVTAIKEGNIVYMPQDTYINEGIQTYTTFFNDVAGAFEKNKSN